MTLFIIHFFLLFLIVNSILYVKPIIFLFLPLYLFFVIKEIKDLLKDKNKLRYDAVYNLMQIGLFLYIFVLFYRIYICKVLVVKENMQYFNINFIILIILMIFIIGYAYIESRSIKNRKGRVYEREVREIIKS